MRPELVELYNECIPGGDINAPGNDFSVSAVIESACVYGVSPNCPERISGNTVQRFIAGLPELGFKRLTAILERIGAIQDDIREKGE